MPPSFLTPPIERLRADGRLDAVHPGGAIGRFRRPVLLLARELCAFSVFDVAALPRGRRRQAARLFARTASPYVISGAALVKADLAFGVWWWDLERVSTMIATRYRGTGPAVRPETLAQPAGRDWRIVKLEEGYEAQLWTGKALTASVWRRERFDEASWTAFTRLQRTAPPAPATPPQAESLPIAGDSEAFSLARIEISRDQAIGYGAAGFALGMGSLALLLLGQGLQLSQDSERMEAEAVQIRTALPQAGATRALDADRQKLAAYRQIEGRTNPLSAAGAAIGIVAIYDLTPSALDASADTLTLTLPYAAVKEASALSEEFEASGYFYDVRPRTDGANQSLIFEMKTREAAPPLSAID